MYTFSIPRVMSGSGIVAVRLEMIDLNAGKEIMSTPDCRQEDGSVSGLDLGEFQNLFQNRSPDGVMTWPRIFYFKINFKVTPQLLTYLLTCLLTDKFVRQVATRVSEASRTGGQLSLKFLHVSLMTLKRENYTCI